MGPALLLEAIGPATMARQTTTDGLRRSGTKQLGFELESTVLRINSRHWSPLGSGLGCPVR